MTRHFKPWLALTCAAAVLATAGCASDKVPARENLAASRAVVENVADAGAGEFAPAEMTAAREKVALATQAIQNKDYKRASDLATQAQADAKLAQGKANSTRAQIAANALQDDIRVLREELNRSSN